MAGMTKSVATWPWGAERLWGRSDFMRAALGWRAAGARVCQPQEGEMGLSHMDQPEHRCSFACEEGSRSSRCLKERRR